MFTGAVVALLVLAASGSPATALQWDTTCPEIAPRTEAMADAVERGDLAFVRRHLDAGGHVNESWRDSRAPMVCRSWLLRSVTYNQDEIFALLLDRGADLRTLPRVALQMPVRAGNVKMVRELLRRGVIPHDNREILVAGLTSRNLEILELLLASGVSVEDGVPAYYLTPEITRFLVPRYISVNQASAVERGQCEIAKLFGWYRRNWDGCEAAVGPFWLTFVLMGDLDTMQFMIAQGADLSRTGEAWDTRNARSFTALDVARRRKDVRMIELLRRVGAR